MDGTTLGLTGSHSGTVLQRFITDREPARRALYWRDLWAEPGAAPSVTCDERDGLHLAADAALSFDTYFNAFFEAQWLRYTTLQSLLLHVTLSGTALLRVWRHALGSKSVVTERIAGPGLCRVAIPLPGVNFRQHGVLSVEISAVDGPVSFLSGAWMTDDLPAEHNGLAAVFCTFNRERDIARVLSSLVADEAVTARLARIFVVNQGRPGLARNPDIAVAADQAGSKLRVIEQANFGGAGGFSRGLLAALDDPAVTHAVLLDDDIELEPDSLLRMAAFYSFCERDIVLGGHMLDLLHPTTLYEAGAVISERHWAFLPQKYLHDIAKPDALERLSQPYAVHYNGWWCCGIPLQLLREHGMPLPCFIRGDDLELGLRLHQRGVPTVPMPGMAVWHEPFYLKLGGWQLYYETRNLLVAAALHKPFDRKGVVRRIGRQIVTHLLTYRYYSTALILQGVEDFLAGPQVMREHPQDRHAGLTAIKQRYPLSYSPRETVAHEQRVLPIPLGRLRCLGLLVWLLVRNAVRPTCEDPPRHILVEKLHWLTVRQAGHIAIETWWDASLPTFRRTREHHRPLLRQAAGLLLRLYRELPRVAAEWREAAPELTSVPFWKTYLSVADTDPVREQVAQNAAE